VRLPLLRSRYSIYKYTNHLIIIGY
jgi:hypothetical protein